MALPGCYLYTSSGSTSLAAFQPILKGMETRKVAQRSVLPTIAGPGFRYNWGSYQKFKLPTDFVSSAYASLINGWWAEKRGLYFVWQVTSGSMLIVSSASIVNRSIPLNQIEPTNYGYWAGTIELEGY